MPMLEVAVKSVELAIQSGAKGLDLIKTSREIYAFITGQASI